jgi:hypothetical protein
MKRTFLVLVLISTTPLLLAAHSTRDYFALVAQAGAKQNAREWAKAVVRLPYSGIAMNVSDWFWQSAWPWDQRIWIAPELYVPPTFASYSTNRDPALEAIRTHSPAP